MRKALVGGRNVNGEYYVVGEEAVIGSASLIVPTSLLRYGIQIHPLRGLPLINKGIRHSEQKGEIKKNYPDDHSLIGSRTDILVTNSEVQ